MKGWIFTFVKLRCILQEEVVNDFTIGYLQFIYSLASLVYYVTIYKKVWRKLSKGQLDLTF